MKEANNTGNISGENHKDLSEVANILHYYLNLYKKALPDFWKDEKYKWEAVQQFQKYWDIEAVDFGSMFAQATSKHGNLLSSSQFYPAGMIRDFAREDAERTRAMFSVLFDESQDLVKRIQFFSNEAEKFRSTKPNDWKNHYQTTNAISVYLTSRFPEKYYIYKYKEVKRAFEYLKLNFSFKGKSEPQFYAKFIDEMEKLNRTISADVDLSNLIDSHLSQSVSLYKDNSKHILTVDFIYYLGKRYQGNRPESDSEEIMHWLLPCNPTQFNIFDCFEERATVDWKQNRYNFQIGDICYIYCSANYKSILFKTEVIETDIDYSEYQDDLKYWTNIENEEELKQNTYARLKLIKKLSPNDDRLGFEKLKENGLTSPIQGPMKVPTKSLIEKIEEVFYSAESDNPRYWVYSPGDMACKWTRCHEQGIACLGWDETGDLSQYSSRAEIAEKLVEIYKYSKRTASIDSLALWQLVKDLKQGDVIYAKRGRNVIVGRGIVVSGYIYDEEADDYVHTVKVNWTHVGAWDSPFTFPMKTLTRYEENDMRAVNQLEPLFDEKKVAKQIPFSISKVIDAISSTGLLYDPTLIKRFAFSLMSKPFLILSGLAGSGKTQLAVAFAKAMSESASQYRIVSVGADWTNREPLLGYPNALQKNEYVRPENDALQLLIDANENPEKPYFLILDEMNLSYVERYFSDFLSVMESHGEIALWEKPEDSDDPTPDAIGLPKNLFIIGTINVDETTYMFSPKVLDRANVIEFKISVDEMITFLGKVGSVDTNKAKAQAANMALSFVTLADNKAMESNKVIQDTLAGFFKELKAVNAEFGYRSATEIFRFISQAKKNDDTGDMLTDEAILDCAIVQKLLPKLHGSRKKLNEPLNALWKLCMPKDNKEIVIDQNLVEKAIYKLSADKIARMYLSAQDNGFTSFAEA